MDNAKIYLVRHTTPDIDKGICYGQSDIPLKDSFNEEAQKVKNLLGNKTFGYVYSSPLTRCIQLANFLGYTYTTDKRLLEYNFGAWELKSWDELYRNPQFEIWAKNYFSNSPPNGETVEDMIMRAKDFYYDCLESNNTPKLIITHSGIIRCFYHLMSGVNVKRIFDIDIPFGSVHIF